MQRSVAEKSHSHQNNVESGDNEAICFVCGADKATWTINSKDLDNTAPFFPFLAYHEVSAAHSGGALNSKGQGRACNVCHSFLVQQWNTYEAAQTPIPKRVYWLKKTSISDGYDFSTGSEHLGANGDTASDWSEASTEARQSRGKSSDRNIQTIGPTMDRCDSDGSVCADLPADGVDECHGKAGNEDQTDARPRELHLKERSNRTQSGQEQSDESTTQLTFTDRRVDVLRQHCVVCRRDASGLIAVHTRPQLKLETPFFPFLSRVAQPTPGGGSIEQTTDGQGKVRACPSCHGHLLRQWEGMQRRRVPLQFRHYEMPGGKGQEDDHQCPICQVSYPWTQGRTIAITEKATAERGEPFYPFVANLLVVKAAEAPTTTTVCCACEQRLKRDWLRFERKNVPQSERVYTKVGSVINRGTCYRCRLQNNELKAISTSPYANVYFTKVNGAEGESYSNGTTLLACPRCYRDLHRQHAEYRSLGVPDSRREYGNSLVRRTVACRLCQAEFSSRDAQCLAIYPSPRGGEQGVPFFPSLAECAPGESKVITCCLCYSNLHCQWTEYESKGSTSPWERTYTVSRFVCYNCATAVHRNDVLTVDLMKNPHLVKEVKPLNAVKVDTFVIICSQCREQANCDRQAVRRPYDVRCSSGARRDNRSGSNQDVGQRQQETGTSEMKATATVQPLTTSATARMNHSSTAGCHGNDDTTEGSFAAALRRLARDALSPPDTDCTSPADRKPIDMSSPVVSLSDVHAGARIAPMSHHHGNIVLGPHHVFHPDSRRPSFPASLAPSPSQSGRDRPEMGSPLASHPIKVESPNRRHHKQSIAGVTSRLDGPQQEELSSARFVKDFPLARDIADRDRRHGHGPLFSQSSAKDRNPSNVGLVHPQRVRKLNSDERKSPSAPSMLSSSSHARDEPPLSNLFRPQSPGDSASSRYPSLVPSVHNHSAGSSCPVHGAEAAHNRHGSPNETGSRVPPSRLPYDRMGLHGAPGTSSAAAADLRAIRSQHHRLQEELFALPRHPSDSAPRVAKEPYSNHALDDEVRRRAFDWPWATSQMQHSYYDSEQYRRQLIGSLRTHDHPYKDLSHNPIYFTHPLYMSRDFPSPMDPYLHPGLIPPDFYHHRHHEPPMPPVSPRLADYYRRSDHHDRASHDATRAPSDYNATPSGDHYVTRLPDRLKPRTGDASEARRLTDESPSPRGLRSSRDRMSSSHGHDFRSDSIEPHLHHEQQPRSPPIGTREHIGEEKDAYLHNLGLVSHLPPRRPTLIHSTARLLSSSATKSPIAPGVLLSHPSPTDVSSAERSREASPDPSTTSLQSDYLIDAESATAAKDDEDHDQKHSFLLSLGLVSHGKRRALEDDYEKKRWERKFQKLRGRPRKKLKKEVSEESEVRQQSDMDLYSGPITRHKQQLLQEQESLLGQVQQPEKDSDADARSTENEAASPRRSEGVTYERRSPDKSRLSVRSSDPFSRSGRMGLKRLRDNDDKGSVSQSQNRLMHHGAKKMYSGSDDDAATLVNGNRSEVEAATDGDRRLVWPGIDMIAHSYAAYKRGLEQKEETLRRGCDDLRTAEEDLSQQSNLIKQEMMTLHDRKIQIGEVLQRTRRDVDTLHDMLRALSSATVDA